MSLGDGDAAKISLISKDNKQQRGFQKDQNPDYFEYPSIYYRLLKEILRLSDCDLD